MGRQLGIAMVFDSKPIPKDIQKSLMQFLLSIRKQARDFQSKQCYFNAQMVLVSSLGSELDGRIRYCEGLYANTKFPMAIPHAWNVLDNEYIVDTTMVADILGNRKANLSDRFIGTYPAGNEYEGICIETEFVMQRLSEVQESISILDDYQSRFSYMRGLEQKIKRL
jgi:hypothetical protein